MKRILLCLLLVLIVVSAASIRQNDKYFEILKNLDVFATMYKEVNANYVDDLNPNTIMRTGIDAMLESLDPYTVYYSEDQIEDVRTENTGQYGGIGATLGERLNGGVYVLMPDKDFAADKAGLKRGDEIVEVNGINVKNDYDKAAEYLRGQVSSKLNLKIKRGDQTLDIEVGLEKIELPNVPYFGMVNEEVGLIKLTGFRPNASREVRSALRDLKKEGATSIMLDLRGNGGGLLNEAVNISNLFIDKDELVVTTKGKLEEMNASYKTLNAATDVEIPVAVLINSTSASASEIVAGVMQDYDRGILVGQKSYGKGLVQRTMPLSYNSQMKVTIAKYYTPSGRCIQAIDYSTRNEDGSVGKIADSLKTAFKTNNGRLVFDGGGVDPDFTTETRAFSPVTLGLLQSDAFFGFYNQLKSPLPQLASAREIEISGELYNQFVAWVQTQSIDYSSKLQRELAALRDLARESGQLAQIESQINSIESKIANDLVADINAAKDEVEFLLKEEMAARLFLDAGRLEASFDSDVDIEKAISVLSNQSEYSATLAGQ
ncbi:S41 family peptidase [Roseivirga pacifica]|uniref:S41 family peptidase n=1 Tax=Roseivirga pacifica TaxID=1267423 RepID=UPI003BAA093E